MSLRSPYAAQIGRGAYSVIVFKDGDEIVAEDDVGTVIAEGSNAATVINAGVDSLPALGGQVFLADNFTITGTITIDTEGVILLGDSWRNSGLTTTADIPLITIAPGASKGIIEKLYLGGADDVLKTNNHGILISGSAETYEFELRDLYIEKTYDGVNAVKVNYLSADNLRCVLCKHDGLHFIGDATSYCSIWATNIMFKQNGHTSFYSDYLMGSKITNLWLEGDDVGYRGMDQNHGWMNWFTNVDCENFTDYGVLFESDGFGSAVVGGWFAGCENGFVCSNSKQVSISNSYFTSNENMGLYINTSDRIVVSDCYAINNSVSGAGAYDGVALNISTNCILSNLIAYDDRGTKKQRYGIQEFGSCDYNSFKGNNLRGNLTSSFLTLGAHNSYDLNLKSTIFDLSGGASDIEVFHAVAPCNLAGYQILYTEASSADTGVNIRIGRYQSGVSLDDDYFDVSTSEVSKNKGYSKFFKTADLTQKVIAVGDTVTVGSVGGKTGAGEICLVLLISEQSD